MSREVTEGNGPLGTGPGGPNGESVGVLGPASIAGISLAGVLTLA